MCAYPLGHIDYREDAEEQGPRTARRTTYRNPHKGSFLQVWGGYTGSAPQCGDQVDVLLHGVLGGGAFDLAPRVVLGAGDEVEPSRPLPRGIISPEMVDKTQGFEWTRCSCTSSPTTSSSKSCSSRTYSPRYQSNSESIRNRRSGRPFFCFCGRNYCSFLGSYGFRPLQRRAIRILPVIAVLQ